MVSFFDNVHSFTFGAIVSWRPFFLLLDNTIINFWSGGCQGSQFISASVRFSYLALRVESLLKTDSGYPKDEGVTINASWKPQEYFSMSLPHFSMSKCLTSLCLLLYVSTSLLYVSLLCVHFSLYLLLFVSFSVSLPHFYMSHFSISTSLYISMSPSLCLYLTSICLTSLRPLFSISTSRRLLLYLRAIAYVSISQRAMGWLRLVGALKWQVSFAEYCLFCRALLQKRPIIWRSLLIAATPYQAS